MSSRTVIRISAVIAIALCAAPVLAPDCGAFDRKEVATAFDRAAGYYGKDQYDAAIAEYEALLSKGIEGGNIYYNIGNCYLKKGTIGRAIVSYERARSFMPRDSDLLFNYRYAKSLIKQSKEPAVRLWILDYIRRTRDFLSAGETIVLTSVLYYLVVFLAGLFVLAGRFKGYVKLALAVSLTALAVMLAWSASKVEDLNSAAIVVVPITDSRLEPLENAPANTPLYEGTRVYVLKSREGWSKVRLSDADMGWLKRDSIELIGR